MNRLGFLIGFAFLLSGLGVPGGAQVPQARIDAVRDMMADAYGGSAPGGAVMVMDRSGVVLAEGFGLADLEWEQAVDERTSFRVGSVSKVITAVAILQRVERGQIRLDAQVSAYLPDLPGHLGVPTVRQLLTHTSGLPDHFARPRMQEIMRNPISFSQLVDLMADAEFSFEPGTQWAYSNFGYVLLGGVLEATDPAGRDYGTIIEQDIFGPLGMRNSHYDRQSRVIPRRARGYDHDGFVPINTITFETSTVTAAGALMLSAEDYGLFSRALLNGQLVELETLHTAWQDIQLPDGAMTGYGLGFNVGTLLGETAIFHSGSISGFQSTWVHLPGPQLTIAVMSNGYYRPNTTMMANQALATLLGQPVPVMQRQPLSPDAVARLEGRYERDDGTVMQLHVQDGVRYNIDGGSWRELAYGGDGLFFVPDTLRHVQIRRDEAGDVGDFVFVDGDLDRSVFRRVGDGIDGALVSMPLDLDAVEPYAGSWLLGTGDQVTLAVSDGVFTIRMPGQGPQRLYAAADGAFFARAVPISVRFAESGEAADLTIYGYPLSLTRLE